MIQQQQQQQHAAAGALLVYDITRRETFNHLSAWLGEAQAREQLARCKSLTRMCAGVVVFLVRVCRGRTRACQREHDGHVDWQQERPCSEARRIV